MKSLVRKFSPKNKTNIKKEAEECSVHIICHSSFMFEIMGLQYFRVHKVNSENYQTGPSKASTIRMILILSILLALVIAYVFFFAPNMNMTTSEETNLSLKNVVNRMINYAMNSFFVMVILVGIVQSFLTTRSYKKFILNLKDVIEMVPKDLDVKQDFQNFSNQVTRRRCFSAIGFVSLHIVAGCIYYFSEDHSEFYVRTILVFIPTLFLVVVTLKIIFIVHLTTQFLELLKKILRSLRNLEENDLEKISIDSILTCRKIYNKIYENSEFINQKFGLTILCSILTFVIAITVSGYELFLLFTREFKYSELAAVMHPNIQCTLLLSAIVFRCQRTTNLVSFMLYDSLTKSI